MGGMSTARENILRKFEEARGCNDSCLVSVCVKADELYQSEGATGVPSQGFFSFCNSITEI